MSCEAIYRPKNRVNGEPKLDNPHYGHKVICLYDCGSFGKVIDPETDTLLCAWKDELEWIGGDRSGDLQKRSDDILDGRKGSR